MLNGLDFLIIVTFLAIIGVGFFSGVTSVTSAIIALYFGAIFASAFYDPLAEFVNDRYPSIESATGQLVFFLLLFFAFTGILTLMVSRWLSDVRLPRRLQVVNNIGGAALGVVVSGMAMTVAAMLLTITLQALNQTITVSGRDSLTSMIRGQIDESTLVPIFLRMAPFFAQMISPWFPGGLPSILTGVPG